MTESNPPTDDPNDTLYKASKYSTGVSPDDEAILKFGEEQFIGSIDTVKNFSQTMITLDSGLFAVYFALLEFLGIKNITEVGTKITTNYIAMPPLLMILSLIAFVAAIMPLFIKIALSIPEDISNTREKALKIKFVCVILGMAFLVAAMAISIDIFLKLVT